MTLTIRLSKLNESMLSDLISKTGENKSYCINRALEEYLEDRLDYLEAEKAIMEMEKLEAKGEKATNISSAGNVDFQSGTIYQRQEQPEVAARI